MKDFSRNFIIQLEKEIQKKSQFSEKDYAKLKNNFSKENKIPNIRNIELVRAYRNLLSFGEISKNSQIEKIISCRKIRSESGVAVISCQTKPYPCIGKCIFCPTEPNMPKSYLSNQPASMRAVLNKFDPFNQVQNRLASLMVTGHETSKCELIIIGGSWSYIPRDYQEEFLTSIYDGLNQEIQENEIDTHGNFFKCPKIERKIKSKTIEDAINKNETAYHRCVGLTLETRPDLINIEEIKLFRRYGCTRVELGIQTLFDDIHEYCNRGHTVKDIETATKFLKDAGFKVVYHIMPGLPGSNIKKDLEVIKMTFKDDRFKPDQIKIYPCVVTKYSELEKWYNEKKYIPLTGKELVPLIIKMKKHIPKYCRIIRLARDIPSESIIAGCKIINLRQVVEKQMKEKNLKCECIRCREIKSQKLDEKNIKINRLNYKASGGDEIFLTFNEKKNDKLISLLRLRIPSQYFMKEKHFINELNDAAIIREVHTYGQQTVIGDKNGNTQHFGFGKKLIEEAERICFEEYNLNKIAVIASVGTREYYKKFGYIREGTYMVKKL